MQDEKNTLCKTTRTAACEANERHVGSAVRHSEGPRALQVSVPVSCPGTIIILPFRILRRLRVKAYKMPTYLFTL